jgi:hypothetical protein
MFWTSCIATTTPARPPARTQSKLRTRICLFFSIAVQAELPSGGGGRGGKQISAGFLGQFFKKNWAKSYQIST